jgi:hypothetical protein
VFEAQFRLEHSPKDEKKLPAEENCCHPQIPMNAEDSEFWRDSPTDRMV